MTFTVHHVTLNYAQRCSGVKTNLSFESVLDVDGNNLSPSDIIAVGSSERAHVGACVDTEHATTTNTPLNSMLNTLTEPSGQSLGL